MDKYTKWTISTITLQALELVLGPRIDSKEFEVRLKIGGIGVVVMKGFEFTGELQVSRMQILNLCDEYLHTVKISRCRMVELD